MVGHTSYVVAVVFNKDSSMLASGGYDNTIRLWSREMENKYTIKYYLEGHMDAIMDIAFNEDSTMVATGSVDCTIKLWREDINNKMWICL